MCMNVCKALACSLSHTALSLLSAREMNERRNDKSTATNGSNEKESMILRVKCVSISFLLKEEKKNSHFQHTDTKSMIM